MQTDGTFWITVTLAFDDGPGSLSLKLEEPSRVAGVSAVISCSVGLLVSVAVSDLDGTFSGGVFACGGFAVGGFG